MIKVVLIIPTLDRSGAEKQLTLLATRLPREEFDVRVIALTRGGPYAADLDAAGVPTTVLHKRGKFDPIAFWRLSRLLKRLRPDIVHTWLFAANAYGRLLVGKRPRPKLIISERCVDSWKSGWQHWLDRKLISCTERMIGNSESVAAFYRDRGFPGDRITVIPNAIELQKTENLDRDKLLAEFGIPAGAPVVGFVGRLARQKRLDHLIWAMELLAHLDENAHFLLVGDGPERDRLVNFTRRIGLEDRIRFAGHRDDVERLLQVVDLFWLASEFEGQSNSVMEAMAAGLPVIASDIPPNRELVVDRETGFLVNPGDRAAFAQTARGLLTDLEMARQMGQMGRERMQSSFSVEKMVSAHATLYRHVLAQPG